jgi:hypothetical protein
MRSHSFSMTVDFEGCQRRYSIENGEVFSQLVQSERGRSGPIRSTHRCGAMSWPVRHGGSASFWRAPSHSPAKEETATAMLSAT